MLLISRGTSVGPYLIEAVVGEGGMGAVYRALDTKLNRPVAVKFLSSDAATATERRRFQLLFHRSGRTIADDELSMLRG